MPSSSTKTSATKTTMTFLFAYIAYTRSSIIRDAMLMPMTVIAPSYRTKCLHL